MKKTFKIIAMTAAVGFSTPAASALTVIYTDTISVTEGSTINGSNLLNLTKFNPALGTLNNVSITITLSAPSFNLIVDNDTDQAASGTVSFGTLGGSSFSSTASTLDGDFNSLSGSNFNVATQSGAFTVAANTTDPTNVFNNDGDADNFTFTTNSVLVGQITTRQINELVWSQWTGATGTVDLDLAVDFVTDLNVDPGGGSGVVRFQGTIPTSTYSAMVTYSYIPEPSTALLGALGALGLLRRRRR